MKILRSRSKVDHIEAFNEFKPTMSPRSEYARDVLVLMEIMFLTNCDFIYFN